MFKWSAFPFIRVSIFLIAGIIVQENYPFLWESYHVVTFALLSASFITWLFLKTRVIHGIITLAFIGYLGGLLACLNDDRQKTDHYSGYEAKGFTATVISDPTEKKNYNRYKVKLHQVKNDSGIHTVSGDLYLYVKKDTTDFLLDYGQVLGVNRGYFAIGAPQNPHEFDYKAYLEKENIFAHAFVKADEIKVVDYSPPDLLLKWAYGIRRYADQQLHEYIGKDRERAILSALLLGIKDQLDNDLKDAYASAGAMHVLAVSGLHVGIIYYILLLIFKSFKDRNIGKFLFVPISLGLIWMYALVTGFSPSVMRAATMFSVIIVSDAFQRRANIYNSLGIAAFLLIVYDPHMVYSVGFQLSFAAVLGIVLLHPWLYRKYEAHTKIGDYLWSITCVSLVAQLATFPLALFYFNQFPTYFLISNLLVIPAALLILSAGILMLLVGAVSSAAGGAIGFLLQWFVWGVNEGVGLLQGLPYPLFDWLYIDKMEVLLIYAAIGSIIYGIGKQSFSTLVVAFCCLLAITFLGVSKEMYQQTQKKIIFYEVEDNVAIDLVSGKGAQLLLSKVSDDLVEVLHYQIDPNRLASGLPRAEDTWVSFGQTGQIRQTDFFDLLYWEGYRVLIVKKKPEGYFERRISSDIVYLEDALPETLEWLDAEILILGSKLQYYEVNRMKALASEVGIATHSLAADGFWALDLNNTTL